MTLSRWTCACESFARLVSKMWCFRGRLSADIAAGQKLEEKSVFILHVFGDPPEDFAKDLPLGCVAHVEGKVFRIGRDEQVRACQALETGDFESEIAVCYDDEFLVEVLAFSGGSIDEEDGTGGIVGYIESPATCMLSMFSGWGHHESGASSTSSILACGQADVFTGRNGITESCNVHQGNGDGISSAGDVLRDFLVCDQVEVFEADAHGRECLAHIGVREFGGIDSSSFPKIVSCGTPGQIAQCDVGLGCGFILAGEPARDSRGRDAETFGESRLGDFEILQESP